MRRARSLVRERRRTSATLDGRSARARARAGASENALLRARDGEPTRLDCCEVARELLVQQRHDAAEDGLHFSRLEIHLQDFVQLRDVTDHLAHVGARLCLRAAAALLATPLYALVASSRVGGAQENDDEEEAGGRGGEVSCGGGKRRRRARK